MSDIQPIKVENKLFQNRYLVDEGNPHITIRDASICETKCGDKACTWCCPAACYTLTDEGGVELVTDGCLECGTCRVICSDQNNIAWEYPRGGYGIQYKFG